MLAGLAAEVANVSANDGPGTPWTDLAASAAQDKVRARTWMAMDILDLATDQMA